MVKRRICALAAALVAAVQIPVSAGALHETHTRQIYCFSDIMRAYIDIEDQNSSPAAKPERSSVIGYIDGTKLTTSSVERFADTGEGVADIFLVDVSGSLKDSQMTTVRAAIKTWANNMKQKDRLAVMTFGDDVNTLIDFSADKKAISSAVDKITNNDNNTQLYGGIAQALKLATRSDTDLPKRRNILLITDGVNDYGGGVSENDVYAQLQSSLVPVYSMWMPAGGSIREKGRATLNSVTEYSGGTFYDMTDKNIDTVYDWIRQSIQDTYAVDFSYGGASADNAEHVFKVRVAENDKVAEDSVHFTLSKTDEESGTYNIAVPADESNSASSEDGDRRKKIIIIAGIAAAVVAAAAAAILLFMRKKKDDAYDEPVISYNAPSSNYNAPSNQPYGADNGKTVGIDYGNGTRGSTVPGVKVTLVSSSGGAESAVVSDKITVGRSSKRSPNL